MYNQWLFNKERLSNIESLNVLLYNGVMKAPTAENVIWSQCNLSSDNILAGWWRWTIFTGKNKEGQPRVTSCKRTLETDSNASGILATSAVMRINWYSLHPFVIIAIFGFDGFSFMCILMTPKGGI